MAIPIDTSGVNSAPPGLKPIPSTQQYIRACKLLVSNAAGQALDLSNLRIKFTVKRTMLQTPNAADILVYNLESNTALQIQKEFTNVVLQGGYNANYGVIFQGAIKQVVTGRENATDTFIRIIASDGDLAYNFAVVAKTIAAGATQQDQVNAAATAMSKIGGASAGGNTTVPATSQLPRGKVLFGNAKDVLRSVAKSTQSAWSIQNEQIVFVPKASYLPGEVVVLNSTTGLVGTPQQTLDGVNAKALMNPNFQMNGRVQFDQNAIQKLTVNLAVKGSEAAANPTRSLTTDGVYFIAGMQHIGDTRGVEWYTDLVTYFIDPTLPQSNAVSVSYD